MPTLTNIDRDLMIELAADPLFIAPNSDHPDQKQLDKLVEYGWVAPTHYRQGGTICRLTLHEHKVLAGQEV